jgi:gluconate 2-dehydrogenase gamma chain
MDQDDVSRRSLLKAIAATLGAAAVPLSWADIAKAAEHAHAAAQSPAPTGITLLTAADAADIEALTSQIIPSDETPGAREAGVVYFIDRALATFFHHMHDDFAAGLAGFQSACHAQNPDASSFAALSSERQAAFLKTVESTPFFDRIRMLTLCGMFTMPSYGGNRDGIGWKLIGFEDQHAFQPPFGYYDRDYPGFVVDPAKPT